MNLRLTLSAAIATFAASIALRPLIGSGPWFLEGAGAVIAVAVVGSLTRLRRLPVIVCLPVTFLGLLFYLNLVFASRQAFLGLLPTGASLTALHRLNDIGWSEAARYAPPVPGVRGITFLAVSGIGLAALATDLLAVRLRKAAAAGLPLLALFSATIASKASTPPTDEALIFCVGVAGYLVLLVTDGRERIQLWGRLVSVHHAGRLRPSLPQDVGTPDTRALAAAGRRVGMAAVAAALLVPLLIPGLHVRDLFGAGPGAGTRGSNSLATLPNPIVQLNQELHRGHAQPILTYKTNNPDPPYLRIYALDLTASAASWTLYVRQTHSVGREGQLPAIPGLSHSTVSPLVHTSVSVQKGVRGPTLGDRTQNFLPLPYPAVTVKAGNGWESDPTTLMMWSANDIGGLNYSVTSKDVEPTADQLRNAQTTPLTVTQYANVPAVYDGLGELARQITAGAATPYDKAIKLQQWFTAPGRFTYSLNVNEPNTPAALSDFLRHSRRGYCQQFAFAFAVLARLLGIPARVAVGYTAGIYQSHGNWLVTSNDAHAWPELYFQGAGWLAWEPTPGGPDAGQAAAKAPLYTIQTGSVTGPGGSSTTIGGAPVGQQPGSSSSAGAGAHVRTAPQSGDNGAGAVHHRGGAWLLWLTVLAGLVLIVALGPMGARFMTRRWRLRSGGRTPRARVHAAWLEISDDLEDFGIGSPASESPRATARRVTGELRLDTSGAGALRRLAVAEERARYAVHLDVLPALRTDVTGVRKAIAAAVSVRTRWRASLLPASKFSAMRRRGAQALDVFGWIDAASSWLWARIRPRRSAGADHTA
jgi:TgpA N-terminal domain/Transglutaminase-like superfamily